MKNRVLHTVWCYISAEAVGEIWNSVESVFCKCLCGCSITGRLPHLWLFLLCRSQVAWQSGQFQLSQRINRRQRTRTPTEENGISSTYTRLYCLFFSFFFLYFLHYYWSHRYRIRNISADFVISSLHKNTMQSISRWFFLFHSSFHGQVLGLSIGKPFVWIPFNLVLTVTDWSVIIAEQNTLLPRSSTVRFTASYFRKAGSMCLRCI